MKRLYLQIHALCVLVLITPVCLGAQDSKVDQPVQLKHRLETVIPSKLKHLLIDTPSVKFHVLVSPRGEMTDYLAVEATHFGLLEKAEKKILDAKFEPAIRNGKPAIGKLTVYVNFFDPEQRAWRRGGIASPRGINASEALERKVYDNSKDRFRFSESKPGELDEPLKLLESKMFLYHAPDEPMAKGKVLVQYYIDFEGHVHLPTILKSDDDYLSLSVLESLKHTRFAPPVKDGNPTFVSVRQPFNFSGSVPSP